MLGGHGVDDPVEGAAGGVHRLLVGGDEEVVRPEALDGGVLLARARADDGHLAAHLETQGWGARGIWSGRATPLQSRSPVQHSPWQRSQQTSAQRKSHTHLNAELHGHVPKAAEADDAEAEARLVEAVVLRSSAWRAGENSRTPCSSPL